MWFRLFFFQEKNGIRYPLWSRGLGDVYKRQVTMIVIYKLSAVSYQIVRHLLNTKFISLPNAILGKEVVPELIQEKVNGQNIANLAMNFVMSDNAKIVSELERIHELLNQNSSVKSAEAVMEFLHG